MKKTMICICCPRGCRMTAEMDHDKFSVTGEGCPRGREYAQSELTDPRRIVTATVAADSGARIPVRTDLPLPMCLIAPLLNRIYQLKLCPPVRDGEVVEKNIGGSGVSLIVSRGR